ncbi:uncharacterized protein LOC117340458 [Pecten maximus]|uniref:uncharacterized protein LOC117340458 n=1 Tax=Pecten maximus TaxID=6579 RepID=UPI001457F34E|nr:uncharacterized protein LOC117340458 [Pecten maximus]
MADLLTRPMSVHFYHRFLKGLTHEKLLHAVEQTISREKIKSIQILDKTSVVTVKDENSKTTLLTESIVIDFQTVRFTSVEKNITNVTIKDAPVEMSDEFINTQMIRFGDVMNGSLKRGKIKGTDIENGTRYIAIVNCISTLPLTTNFGRFPVRLFGDNNRTPCFRCGQTDHPSYRCQNRREPIRKCHRCVSLDHMIRDCTATDERKCHFCNEPGHLQRDCTKKQRLDMYGEYADEIDDTNTSACDSAVQQLQQPNESDVNKPTCARENNETPPETQNDGQEASSEDPITHVNTVILGASNANRMEINDDNILNASINGASYCEIDRLIDKAKNMTNETIEKVVVNLGTNDIMSTKNDTDQVTIKIIEALKKVENSFPASSIGLCSIIKRKAKGTRPQAFNDAAVKINSLIKKLCDSRDNLTFVDCYDIMTRDTNPIGAYYDKHDTSGVHVNSTGARKLLGIMQDFMRTSSKVVSNGEDMQTPTNSRKRYLSDKYTPPEAKVNTKTQKI